MQASGVREQLQHQGDVHHGLPGAGVCGRLGGAPFEVISTEDLLAAINNINTILARLRAENGGIIDEAYEIVCI